MKIVTRFAPSPTGFLHVGNVRTAIVNYLHCKKMNGEFILRFDDTDLERSKSEYVEQIKQDLQWLGIEWQREEYQSKRLARYEEVKQKLIADGRLYECFETKEELDFKRKLQLNQGKPPIYDRAALKLSIEQKEKFIAEGRKPHYRFFLKDQAISWNDEVRGENRFDAKNLTDPIIFRNDGSMTYILASVIDDVDFEVTHVLRGEDHVSNSAIQVQIFEALGAKPPTMGHMSLIKAKDSKISKRIGGFAIKDLRARGIEPMVINSFLAKIGTSDAISVKHDMQELIDEFDIKKFGRAPATFMEDDLDKLNSSFVLNLPFEQVTQKLKDLQITEISEEFWNSIKENIENLQDVKMWQEICQKGLHFDVENEEDRNYLESVVKFLPEQWDENVWQVWLAEVKKNVDRKGKKLFMPIRKALTGREDGPELHKIFYLLGKDEIINRLRKK